MGIFDWMKRKPKGVQAVKVVEVNKPAPVVDKAVKRVCRWCSRPWPVAQVSVIGLCPHCQRAHDRREEYINSLKDDR